MYRDVFRFKVFHRIAKSLLEEDILYHMYRMSSNHFSDKVLDGRTSNFFLGKMIDLFLLNILMTRTQMAEYANLKCDSDDSSFYCYI